MKTLKHLRNFFSGPSLSCLVMALLFANVSFAGSNSLAGPPFTDPEQVQVMPSDWIKKSIEYEKTAAGADITVTLDGQLYHAWEPVIQEFAEKYGLKIIITRGTCGLSAGKLLSKSVDIGVFCCPPGKTDRVPGLVFHTMGIAAIALLIHPDNPLENIMFDQARKIFTGEIYRWPRPQDMGKPPWSSHRIHPIGRLHCRQRPGHWRLLLDNEDLFSPSLFEVGAIPDMISQVSINPEAIGYEILWMARYHSNDTEFKFLRIDGHSPGSADALVSGKYPLYRTYNFAYWKGGHVSNPHVKGLMEYLAGKVEQLDPKYGFVPASLLRKAGWKFKDNELVEEPD